MANERLLQKRPVALLALCRLIEHNYAQVALAMALCDGLQAHAYPAARPAGGLSLALRSLLEVIQSPISAALRALGRVL